jgi:valyl-tRNA synthetase
MRNLALLIEVLDEAMRLLPPTVPSFTKLKIYEPLPNLQRGKRVNANGLKTRRSKAFNKTTRGLDDEVHTTT